MLLWLHQGPPYAYVEHVEAEWGQATGEFGGFSVRY
jgi:acylphosphatase